MNYIQCFTRWLCSNFFFSFRIHNKPFVLVSEEKNILDRCLLKNISYSVPNSVYFFIRHENRGLISCYTCTYNVFVYTIQ